MAGDRDQTEVAETDVLREEGPPEAAPGRVPPRGAGRGGVQPPPDSLQPGATGRDGRVPAPQVREDLKDYKILGYEETTYPESVWV